jgi:parallel beta-helix repeat protein/predicted outer membrane repeat protein
MARIVRSSAGVTILLFVGLSLAFAVTLTAPRTVGADPGVLYAAPTALGSEDCSNWANACTLQDALTIAQEGDEIWVKAGVHRPTADPSNRSAYFALQNGVTLYGGFAGAETSRDQRNWQTNLTVLSGDIDNNDITDPNGVVTTTANITGTNSYRVVVASYQDASAVLDGLTITAGQADGSVGGGMYNHSSDPTLTNIVFSANTGDYGGGMYNSGSNPTLANVTFISNTTSSTGGGMYNESSSPNLTNVTFTGNTASGGGGMYSWGSSSPTLTDVTFISNTASSGGGMYNSGSSPTLANVTFTGNTASSGYGGGMHNYGSSSPTLTDVTFISNTASNGGGMFNSGSSPNLTNVTFTGNTASSTGGGMYNNDSSSPNLTNVTFTGNTASSTGGGMENYGSSSPNLTNVTFSHNTAQYGGGINSTEYSSPTLVNVTFSHNTAQYGGGMDNYSSSSPTLVNVTFSNNTAQYGGGMSNYSSSSPALANVTFIGNTASEDGGGMYNYGSSSPTLTNVTFSRNAAGNCGGAMENLNSSPALTNTILWADNATQRAEIGNGGVLTAIISHSDIQDCITDGGVWVSDCGQDGGGNIDADPQFASAAAGNLRLQRTSPCIDAGDNSAVPAGVTTDLDGNPRFADIPTVSDTGNGTPPVVDMGAYETQNSVYLPLVLRSY